MTCLLSDVVFINSPVYLFEDTKTAARLNLYQNKNENVSRLRREAMEAQEESAACKKELEQMQLAHKRLQQK